MNPIDSRIFTIVAQQQAYLAGILASEIAQAREAGKNIILLSVNETAPWTAGMTIREISDAGVTGVFDSSGNPPAISP